MASRFPHSLPRPSIPCRTVPGSSLEPLLQQRLVARLGLWTRLGLAELAPRRLGRAPAALLLATLVVSCVGAPVTHRTSPAEDGDLSDPLSRESLCAKCSLAPSWHHHGTRQRVILNLFCGRILFQSAY